MIKYPSIKVKLTGMDENAVSVLWRVCDAMKRSGITKEERNQFINEATSSDYNHLLKTCQEWVTVS